MTTQRHSVIDSIIATLYVAAASISRFGDLR